MAEDFKKLKELLNSDQWPAAVEPSLICDVSSEQDKEYRAEGILDLIIDISLNGLSFLDFGCGEGHVVEKAALQKPKISVGYDIVQSERWEQWPQNDNMTLTTKWEDVVAKGPYNVILLYDVVDHIEEDVIEELKKIKEVLSPGGKVFVRCHPWCSRHGTHLYRQINKAYIHLVFTEEELKELGFFGQKTREVIHPIATYEKWFKKAGFRIPRASTVMREGVNKFFLKNELIANRIKARWKTSSEKEFRTGKTFPTFQMEQQFIDWVIL